MITPCISIASSKTLTFIPWNSSAGLYYKESNNWHKYSYRFKSSHMYTIKFHPERGDEPEAIEIIDRNYNNYYHKHVLRWE